MEELQQTNSLSIIENVNLNQVQSTMGKILQFQAVVQQTLKESHDYGKVPGCGNKPTLLKPGAEKILMLLGLTSEYDIIEKIQDYEKGFFAFTVKCKLSKNGQVITEGVGHCNSMEKKYASEKVDVYTIANTCLKMAKKRSQVDASLTVASLSEIFTQDIEDMGKFEQSEQLENMTVEEAANIKITFGKNKGKTLGEIYKTDASWIEWFMTKADKRDPVIEKAINILAEAAKQHKESKVDKETGEILDTEFTAVEDDPELPWNQKDV